MKKRTNAFARPILFILFLIIAGQAMAFAPKREFYEIRVYHLKDKSQEDRLDSYLQNAYLPALHRVGIKTVGVFKPWNNDTSSDRRVFVLIPYKSLEQFTKSNDKLINDKQLQASGADYINAMYNNATYTRMEKILLQAFPNHPVMSTPKLTGPKSERFYELRSYESATEKLHQSKVKMFNEGGEVAIFDRLGFNPVFYGAVISGSRMPNLMYMTTFENKAARDEHWKSFTNDAQWKALSPQEEYKNNVSKNEQTYLRPTEYSDF